MEQAIYQPGSKTLVDVIKDGCLFYSRVPVEEYLKKHSTHLLLPLEEALEQIEINCDEDLRGGFKEISYDAFNDAMCCLPPEKFEKVGTYTIFRMSEYFMYNFTEHYIMSGTRNRYFSCMRRTTESYDSIIKELEGWIVTTEGGNKYDRLQNNVTEE